MFYKALWGLAIVAVLFSSSPLGENTARAQPAVGVYTPYGPNVVVYRRPYYRGAYRRAYYAPYYRPYYRAYRPYRYWW